VGGGREVRGGVVERGAVAAGGWRAN